MYYRLNIKRLDECMKAYKGGAEAVFKLANTSSSKYYYNVNKGSFTSDFLILLCDVLKKNPAEFFEELDDNYLPIAAEPAVEYKTGVGLPSSTINVTIFAEYLR